MSKSNNKNTKGNTNVKSELIDVDNSVRSAKSGIFDSKKAKIDRSESNWDDFQVMGESNGEEAAWSETHPVTKSNRELRSILDRGFAFRMGRKIRLAMNVS